MGIELLYPCKSGGDAQPFIAGQHYGIDFGWIANESDDILASADGTIEYEGFWKDVINGKEYYPIMVIIKHDIDQKNDYYTLYTHLASTCVDKGQKVKCGQKIGVKGNTGFSQGKHLHFQLMRMKKNQPLSEWDKNAIDPQPFLYRTNDQIYKYQGYVYIPLKEGTDEEGLKAEIEKLKAEIEYVQHQYEKAMNELEKAQDKIARIKENADKIKEIANE